MTWRRIIALYGTTERESGVLRLDQPEGAHASRLRYCGAFPVPVLGSGHGFGSRNVGGHDCRQPPRSDRARSRDRRRRGWIGRWRRGRRQRRIGDADGFLGHRGRGRADPAPARQQRLRAASGADAEPERLATSPPRRPTPAGADPLLGTDGRLTVLLLGSDYRPAHPGNRTDAIMVVSVDPASGKTAAFSVPRDTSGFPLPSGGRFGNKINALYQYFLSNGRSGGASMEAAFSKAFGIEIDGYVFIGFSGVKNLVDAVGGVDVVLSKAYYDPYYFVNNHHQGWGLPAGKSHLNGAKALIFARSRKGDNDFGRARRQQLLVAAAMAKVRSRGPLDPAPAPEDRPGHRPDGPAAQPGGRPVRGHLAGEPEDRGQGGLRPAQVRRRDRRIVLVRAQAGRLPGLDRGALPAEAAVRDVAGRDVRLALVIADSRTDADPGALTAGRAPPMRRNRWQATGTCRRGPRSRPGASSRPSWDRDARPWCSCCCRTCGTRCRWPARS